MIEYLITAEKECTKHEDVNPNKILRPIGTIFKEWIEPEFSTEPPRWIHWKVIGYCQSYKGRKGDTLLYERYEEIVQV